MNALNWMGTLAVLCWTSFALNAQTTEKAAPRDNFYDRYMHTEKQALAYDHVHEKDVFFEKRIWREIDTRTKRNQHFNYPLAPFAKILIDAVKDNKVTAYSTWSDDFTKPLSLQAAMDICVERDTFIMINPSTFEEEVHTSASEVNAMDIKKFRIKEVWYFDEETGDMNVRILGIAPIIDRYDDNGNFLLAMPMFWLYYPDLRPILATKESFNPENDAMRMSWDDVFEARFFESHITKASNVHDARLMDQFAGIDILIASDKVQQELLHFEHDLWEY